MFSVACIVCTSDCLRWRSFGTIFLTLICCSAVLNAQHHRTQIHVNTSTSVIDMSNYTEILLTIECPEQYDHTGWYHDGKYLEGSRVNGNSLLYIVEGLKDGGVFKCGPTNGPLANWNSVNITIGRKPLAPQSLICTGHLFKTASCTWQSGSRETNLPGTFIAEKRISNYEWIHCNNLTEEICVLDRGDGLRNSVRVWEVNKLGISQSTESFYRIDKDVRPFPPNDLTLQHSIESKILARWGTSEGWQYGTDYIYLKYDLRYRTISSNSVWQEVPVFETKQNYEFVFVGWNIYTTYEVQVRAQYHLADAPGMWSGSVNITTNEAYPVGQLVLLDKEIESDNDDKETYRNILLTWEVPDVMKARGEILGFEIQLLESGIHKYTFNLTDGSINNYTFKDLLRNANYTVYMSAYNSVSSSTPTVLDIAPSPTDLPTSAIVIAVIVCVAVVILFLILGIGWSRVKKATVCLPFPEPNVEVFKWKNIPHARAYVEDEVFDEIRQRRAVPTKDELDRLMRKLPDPALKDVILELLISKYSIDHDWQRMEKRRMSRLLSNDTEISFLSDNDEEEHLINNLSSPSECTVLSNMAHIHGGLARCHSLPILHQKYTKDVNVKEEPYTSDSGNTSGIGSESSDQDIENECLIPRHSVPDGQFIPSIHCATLGKQNINSPYTEPVKFPNLSQKNHNNMKSKDAYIAPKDVAKVVQSPPINQQTPRQSSVSDYLNPAQMRRMQNHPRKLKQKRLIRRKPKPSDNGYVDVKDMPKFISHRPKIPAENMPKPSVYVQHQELQALLASKTTKNPSHPDQNVENSRKSSSDTVSNDNQVKSKQTNKLTDTCNKVNDVGLQNKVSNVSPYVQGASISYSGVNKSIMSSVKPSNITPKTHSIEKEPIDNSRIDVLNKSVASVSRKPKNTCNISTETSATTTKPLANIPQATADYVTLDEVGNGSLSQFYSQEHQKRSAKDSAQKQTPAKTSGLKNTKGSVLSRHILHPGTAPSQSSSVLLAPGPVSESVVSQNVNGSGLSKHLPISGMSGLQNTKGSALSQQMQPCGTSGSQNINRSVFPKQKPPTTETSTSQNIRRSVLPKQGPPTTGTSTSQNIRGNVLTKQRPPTWTSGSQVISGSALPVQRPGKSASQNINRNVLPKQSPPTGMSTSQNIRGSVTKQSSPTGTSGSQVSGSALSVQRQPCGTSTSQNIRENVFPKQRLPTGTSISQNINRSALPKQGSPTGAAASQINSPPSGTSSFQNIPGQTAPARTSSSPNTSGSALPMRGLSSGNSGAHTIGKSALPKQNNSDEDQACGYIPIRSMVNATVATPVAQPHSNRVRQKIVPRRSHFQNQGRMMKGQFKTAKLIYKVSPSL